MDPTMRYGVGSAPDPQFCAIRCALRHDMITPKAGRRTHLRTLFILVLTLASEGGASGAMPAAEQNALVKQYCAVCHTDAARSGGLSLEHYDAAKRNPPLAAMMLSKLNNNAMGA